MKNWIFKKLLLWKKEYLLWEITIEDVFLSFYFNEELKDNIEEMASDLEAMKKDPKRAGTQEAVDLQARIVESAGIASRLKTNHKVKHELEMFIKTIRQA